MSQDFTKYREKGAYHWKESSCHIFHGWPYTRSRVDWVVRQCLSCRTVLEIGCGDGVILGKLAKQGKTVCGVDADETALQFARSMFSQEKIQGEFFSTLQEVRSGKFDAIILAEVIEHIDDPKELLNIAVQNLGQSGRLILTTPIRLLERSPDPHHVHEYWPLELEALLKNYFSDINLVRLHPAWFVDLMCFGIKGVRPLAVLANLIRICTGIELIDRLPSAFSMYWTQAVVCQEPIIPNT